MTVDALEYLRSEDPVPHGSTAPPMQWVLTRIESTGTQPGRRRIALALVPTMAVAATLAVVAVVVLAVIHRGHTPAHTPPAARTTPAVRSVPSPGSLMPSGGMRGSVFIDGATSPSPDGVLVYIAQCQPCHDGGSGAGSATHIWQAATIDGGASWHVAHTSLNLSLFGFAGRDGWAEGVGSDRIVRFFASHDGGRTWHVASSAAAAPGGVGNVSIAGGEVWSLGDSCPNNNCLDAVLRAPASSDHLAATAAQPPLSDGNNVSVVAAARATAYVMTDGTNDTPQPRAFATHDGGRSWQSIATPCTHHSFGRLYGGRDALWALCEPRRGPTQLRRSTDGGAHWTTLASRPVSGTQLQPASALVAWALTPAGKVFRTSDGGRTWTRVWYSGHPAPSVLGGSTPPGLNRSWSALLTVQSATTATVIAVVSRGRVDGHAARTNLVTYRTTDGGRTWRPTGVRLPAG